MGQLRLFKKSVRFTFRSRKRFIVFLLIFAIVSSLIAFYIDSLDTLRTDRFLEQKGVVMTQLNNHSVSYQEGLNIFDTIVSGADNDPNVKIENSVIFRYAELDPFIRIYSIDINKPWFSNFAKPSLIVEGKYPEKSNEILVPSGSSQIYSSTVPGVLVKSKVAVGQKFTFTNDEGDKIDFNVVGTLDTSKVQEREEPDRLWFFVDQSKFEDLMTLFGKTIDESSTYSITFTVPGDILSFQRTDTHKLVESLNDLIKTILITNNPNHGTWIPQPDILPSAQAKDEATKNIVNLAFVVIGGIVLATMFAYLISRFRRREIAILKAMGYAHKSVRTSLIAEILTIAFFGFVTGISLVQGLLFYISGYSGNSLLTFEAILASFAINVLISLPGMLFASRKVLGVSPSEAFRDR